MEDIIFKNREDAGNALAALLVNRYKQENSLVLGISHGGIEVAYQVAQQLEAELSLVVSKKLPYPGHEEHGFGAIAEGHFIYVSTEGKQALEPGVIDSIIENRKKEVSCNIRKYRYGKPLPLIKERTIILVDEGIATGHTMVPVIRLCRKREAARIVIATPVSGTWFDPQLHEADEMVVVTQPSMFYAVDQAYENFENFSDEKLSVLLQKADRERKKMQPAIVPVH
jgi:putative phosphoribosyl transferase